MHSKTRSSGRGEKQPTVSPLFEVVGTIESSDVYTGTSTEVILAVIVVSEHETACCKAWFRVRRPPDAQTLVPFQNVLAIPPVESFTQQIATTCRLPGHTEVGQLLSPRTGKIQEGAESLVNHKSCNLIGYYKGIIIVRSIH